MLLLRCKLLLGSKLLLLLRSELLLLLRSKLLLLLWSKLLLGSLPLLSLSKKLVQLSLRQLGNRGRLSCWGWGDRLWSTELGSTRLRLEGLLPLLELLWLLRLRNKLLLLGNGLLEVSWQRINLTITIFISGEPFKGNLFLSQLGQRCQSRLLWLRSKLLLLLRGKLLLGSKLLLLVKSWLLLLSRGKLLGVLSKLLVLGKLGIKLARLLGKLLSGLLSKLLLGLLGKLLSWLLRLLLPLLKLLEVLIEVLGIELFRCRTAGVKVGSIKHRASGSLSTLVCKCLALG